MFDNFSEIREAAKSVSGGRVAIPMGHDPASMEALCEIAELGLASAVIVAPESAVRESVGSLGRSLPDDLEVVDEEDPARAAERAVRLVAAGEATVLMKGMLKTSLFQKAILDKEYGLRTGRVLSHVAVLRAPTQERLVAVSDGGMNIRPEEEELVQIAENAVGVIKALGAEEALVAMLAAIEVENEKMPETLVAARIASRGIPGAEVQGPLAVDVAVDPEAAEVKGVVGPVAGRANVMVTPDIACGNIFVKGLMYMASAEVGGLIAGAAAPIVMLSRSDKPEAKVNSLALGVVVGERAGNV